MDESLWSTWVSIWVCSKFRAKFSCQLSTMFSSFFYLGPSAACCWVGILQWVILNKSLKKSAVLQVKMMQREPWESAKATVMYKITIRCNSLLNFLKPKVKLWFSPWFYIASLPVLQSQNHKLMQLFLKWELMSVNSCSLWLWFTLSFQPLLQPFIFLPCVINPVSFIVHILEKLKKQRRCAFVVVHNFMEERHNRVAAVSFEEKPDSWSKGSTEDIRSFLGEDSAPMWRYDQIKKECGKVMLSHFGTVVNCARLGSQSPQCSELFSMFGSQSSLALLLWWRALVKSISGDGSVIFRLVCKLSRVLNSNDGV